MRARTPVLTPEVKAGTARRRRRAAVRQGDRPASPAFDNAVRSGSRVELARDAGPVVVDVAEPLLLSPGATGPAGQARRETGRPQAFRDQPASRVTGSAGPAPHGISRTGALPVTGCRCPGW